MKGVLVALCTFVLLGATPSFAQDRSTEDTQGKNAAPDPAANGTGATQPTGNTTQDKSALQSGHEGEAGAQLTLKQCQDLSALEAKNPNLERDPIKDKACAQVLGKATSGDSLSVNDKIKQNRNAAQSGHEGAEGTLLTRKECQDLASQEAKNPNLERDPAKDRRCARILGTAQSQ